MGCGRGMRGWGRVRFIFARSGSVKKVKHSS